MKMKKNGTAVTVGLSAVAEVAPALPLKKKPLVVACRVCCQGTDVEFAVALVAETEAATVA